MRGRASKRKAAHPHPETQRAVHTNSDADSDASLTAENRFGTSFGDALGTVDFPSTAADENWDDADDEQQHKQKGKAKTGGFQSMGLSPFVYRSVMRKGYRVPTPIQRKAIPAIMEGRDVVAMARTGSGKTAAFLIPLLEKLGSHSTVVGVRGLVLSPTRELALQTHKFCLELSHFVKPPLRFALVVGGDAVDDQFDVLARNPDAIVGTPGRLQHVLVDAQLSLSRVEYVVCDEADRLFEMGFASQLDAIIASVPPTRQTLLFSATMPALLADFTRARLHEPQLIRLDLEMKLSDALEITFFRVRPQEKIGALLVILGQLLERQQQTIVFTSTRHHVELLHELLLASSFESAAIYGSLDPAARKIALGKFRAGKARVLVVTDVAARGIDVPLLDNVVNFDFPSKPKLFVHRAGRAARAGRAGRAVSLVEPEELPYLIDLQLYLGRRLRPVQIDEFGAESETERKTSNLEAVDLAVFPPTALETEVEYVQRTLAENPELDALNQVAQRSMQMVRKTRAAASKASVARARELPTALGIHPLLQGKIDAPAEARRSSLLLELKRFKPSSSATAVAASALSRHGIARRDSNADSLCDDEAVVQASMEPTAGPHKGGWQRTSALGLQDAANSVSSTTIEAGGPHEPSRYKVMRVKKRQRRIEAADFRDSAFYMSHEKQIAPDEAAAAASDAYLRVNAGERGRLDDAVMDLVEDERDGLRKRASVLRWDARKKKYVREALGQSGVGATDGIGDRGKKRLRDESGALVKEKVNLYEEWRKNSKRRIQAPGEAESTDAKFTPGMHKKRRHDSRFMHTATKPLPNAGAKSELKSEQQIAKERREKAKKAGKGGGGKGKEGGKGGGVKGRGGGKGSRKGGSHSSGLVGGKGVAKLGAAGGVRKPGKGRKGMQNKVGARSTSMKGGRGKRR